MASIYSESGQSAPPPSAACFLPKSKASPNMGFLEADIASYNKPTPHNKSAMKKRSSQHGEKEESAAGPSTSPTSSQARTPAITAAADIKADLERTSSLIENLRQKMDAVGASTDDDSKWWRSQLGMLRRLIDRLKQELPPMQRRPARYGLGKKHIGRMAEQLEEAEAWQAFIHHNRQPLRRRKKAASADANALAPSEAGAGAGAHHLSRFRHVAPSSVLAGAAGDENGARGVVRNGKFFVSAGRRQRR